MGADLWIVKNRRYFRDSHNIWGVMRITGISYGGFQETNPSLFTKDKRHLKIEGARVLLDLIKSAVDKYGWEKLVRKRWEEITLKEIRNKVAKSPNIIDWLDYHDDVLEHCKEMVSFFEEAVALESDIEWSV